MVSKKWEKKYKKMKRNGTNGGECFNLLWFFFSNEKRIFLTEFLIFSVACTWVCSAGRRLRATCLLIYLNFQVRCNQDSRIRQVKRLLSTNYHLPKIPLIKINECSRDSVASKCLENYTLTHRHAMSKEQYVFCPYALTHVCCYCWPMTAKTCVCIAIIWKWN